MGDTPHDLRQSGTFQRIQGWPDTPCPIEPAWMRSGTPVTRCNEHSTTADGLAWTMVWDCTRSTFEWHYSIDEVVVILEGSVRVTDCHGTSHTLNAGDVGYFPCGSSWLWEVDHYVRKVAFCRNEVPRAVRLPLRVWWRLKRELHGNGSLARVGPVLKQYLHRMAGVGRTTATLMLIGMPL